MEHLIKNNSKLQADYGIINPNPFEDDIYLSINHGVCMSNFPDPPRPMRPTSFKEIDKALRRLLGGKHPWARLGTEKRALLLEECITDLKMVADEWVPTVCRGKGHLPGSPGEGETWIGSFMLIMRNLRLLHHAMKHKAAPPLISSSQNANAREPYL